MQAGDCNQITPPLTTASLKPHRAADIPCQQPPAVYKKAARRRLCACNPV